MKAINSESLVYLSYIRHIVRLRTKIYFIVKTLNIKTFKMYLRIRYFRSNGWFVSTIFRERFFWVLMTSKILMERSYINSHSHAYICFYHVIKRGLIKVLWKLRKISRRNIHFMCDWIRLKMLCALLLDLNFISTKMNVKNVRDRRKMEFVIYYTRIFEYLSFIYNTVLCNFVNSYNFYNRINTKIEIIDNQKICINICHYFIKNATVLQRLHTHTHTQINTVTFP